MPHDVTLDRQVKAPADPLSHPCRGESGTGFPEAFLNCSQKRLGFVSTFLEDQVGG